MRSTACAGWCWWTACSRRNCPTSADLEKGLGIRTLREVLEAGDAALQAQLFAPDNSNPMVALNSAMMTDGVVIEVADGAVLTQPLHIVHIASGARRRRCSPARCCGSARPPARRWWKAISRADGAKAYQVHDSLVDLDRRRCAARPCAPDRGRPRGLQHFLGRGDARRARAFQHLRHDQRRAASAATRRSSRLPARAREVETNGVNLLNGRQHADTTLFLDHAVPNCASREIFRAVVDDRGHSVFQGRIIVRPKAQKTDAKMMTRALLLSDEAEADNKPELEIFADDVTCGHGATTGALDESLLFYLRARGLSEKEAQALLIQAFVGEAIESDRQRRLARTCDRGGAALAGGAGMTMHPAVSNGSYDVARVREDFPALALKVYGKPLVYLDNAASAQKPNAVLDRMTRSLQERIRQRASRPALPRQCGDRSL